jgi:hypothetical protein
MRLISSPSFHTVQQIAAGGLLGIMEFKLEED